MIKQISIRQVHDVNGKDHVNEFIIITPEGRYYQSHDRRIAAVIDGNMYIDEVFYDRAIAKSINLCNHMFFLLKKAEVKQRIECRLIKKIDLNY